MKLFLDKRSEFRIASCLLMEYIICWCWHPRVDHTNPIMLLGLGLATNKYVIEDAEHGSFLINKTGSITGCSVGGKNEIKFETQDWINHPEENIDKCTAIIRKIQRNKCRLTILPPILRPKINLLGNIQYYRPFLLILGRFLDDITGFNNDA